MEVDNRKILIAIVIITLLLFPAVAFTSGALRIVLGLLFVLFLPGYTLLSALFPKRGKLDTIERTALSFGLSIAVVPSIGLILNYTPWGISIYPILVSITLFILVTSAIAWYRQRKLPHGERFSVTVSIALPKWGNIGGLDRALSFSLVVAVLLALGCFGYVIATPKQGEKFTEFYILGVDGKAENYPREVVLGEPVEFIVGIINHEYDKTIYRVTIKINDVKRAEIVTGALANDEKWQEEISFVPQSTGEEQKVELWLYKNNETQPYNSNPLHLYINVIEPSSVP